MPNGMMGDILLQDNQPEQEIQSEVVQQQMGDAEQVREQEYKQSTGVQYVLDKDERTRIAEYIVQLVDKCIADRAEWHATRIESVDLLEGKRPPKSDPWPNCSNISTMATSTHCKLIHAKLLPTVWNENLIYWRPTEKNDVDNVEKVNVFMKYIIRKEIHGRELVDDIIWAAVTDGTVALKLRWITEYKTKSDIVNGILQYNEVPYQKCVVDLIPIDEVYMPLLWLGENDSEFIAQDIYMRKDEIDDLIDRGIYIGDDIDMLSPKTNEEVQDSLRQKTREVEGTEGSSINMNINSMPIRLIECYMKWPVVGDNGKKQLQESVFVISYESKAYLSGKPLAAVSPIGDRPWVIGQLIRRIGRPYGVGYPELMRGLSKELDAIHNQRIDAGSIAIAPFGFYRAASSFKPQAVQIGPGTMIPVDDINDVNIISLQHNPVVSFQEERIIVEYIEKLTGVSAYQMGRESDIVKSRATATATMSLISQGEQAFNVIGNRCQSIVSRLLTKILQQYQMHMPPGYAERIIGDESGNLLFPDGLTREDIYGQFDAYMTLDATVSNKSMDRQANAVLVQMGVQLLALAQDPRGWEMASEFIKSIGKQDVEKFIGPKPQQRTGAGLPMGPGLANVLPQQQNTTQGAQDMQGGGMEEQFGL